MPQHLTHLKPVPASPAQIPLGTRLTPLYGALAGGLVGLVFPAVAWSVDILASGLDFSAASVAAVHAQSLWHWLLDLAPPALAFTGFLGGRQRLHAEQELRRRSLELAANEHYLRVLLESLADGVITIDDRGVIQGINSRAAKMFGYTPGMLVGRDLALLMPEPYRQAHNDAFIRHLANGPGQPLGEVRELSGQRADGSIFPLELSIAEVKSVAAPLFVGTVRDVSARRAREAERRRLVQALESSADAVMVTDADARIIYVNPAFCSITGWPREEALGQLPSILKSDRNPAEVYAELWHRITHGENWSGRILNRRRPRAEADPPVPEYYWAAVTVTPIRDQGDKPLGFVAIHRDVTAEVEAEQHDALLRESAEARARIARHLQEGGPLRERLRRVLECLVHLDGLDLLHQGAVYIQPEGGDHLLRYLIHGDPPENPGFEPPPRLPLEALAYGEPTPEPAVRFAALCSDSGCADHCPAPGPDHGHLLVALGHGGKQLGTLFLFTPPQAGLETPHLETLRQVGEQIGLAISSDRVHRALTEARRNAEGAARAKSEFLASMSHEIRTPMHGVLGMLELIRNTPLTEEQHEYVDTARSSADSLLNLINDILDFTKIEAGRIELAQLEFDPALLMEEVTSLLARSESASGLEVACHIPAPLPALVRGDPFRLRQVLTNLVGNAVKFTEAGEVVVRAEVEAATEGEVRLRFTIRDTGIGIDTATRERLFQVFYQADSTDTRRYGGTGLGLAISKQLVELMGGGIGVESRPGLGSTFWFSVRLGRVADAGRPRLAELAGLKVLVVDDNATNRLILRDYLRHMGLEAVECVDGRTALEKLEAAADAGSPLPVALLDLQMPGMDGLELAHRIRTDARLARTTLVLLSSITPGDSERAGIDAWLMKPVRQGQLQDALLTVLRHDRPARPDPVLEPKSLSGRILLVEDNPVNQKVARSMLRKLGLEAEVAANGRVAMTMVESERFDVILMDCQMPEMDGFEATTAIRRLEQERGLPRTPVIAMTAAALAGDRDRCLSVGMDDFLSKPVKLGVLREAVMRWLPDAGAREPVHNSE